MDQEIRSLAFLQYPIELADSGLESVLKSLARNFGRHTDIQTSFRSVGDFGIVNNSVAVAILRVAQEALANVHRHAHAAHSKIRLKWLSTCVELTVSDDGIGVLVAAKDHEPRGIGLRGMRHRVERLGGRLKIRGLRPGTQISAIIPLTG
jgi:signal transduction histidine kinase